MPKSSIECAGSNVTGPRYAFNPLRSGTLLVIAVMIALGFLMILRPMVRDGAPGDYETRRGDILLTDGAYGAAIAEFDRALTVSPAHRGAIMGRAIALMESGQSSAAEEEFGRLIRLLGTSARDDPTGMATLAAAYANRGILRDRDGRVDDALADYRRALGLDAGAVAGPGLVDRVLHGAPQASSVAKRAAYLEEQLALPPQQQRLHIPERDARERMHKP